MSMEKNGRSTEVSVSEPLRAYLDSREWWNSVVNARSIYLDDRGIKLHIFMWEKGQRDPCIIFIHGMGLHSLFFSGFMSKLSEQGFNVLGLDILGHGRRGGDRGHFTMQRATENVSRVIDWILETFNDRVGVMGISLGGMITFYSVANDPRIRSAVCAGLAHPKLPLRRGPTRLFIDIGAKLRPRKRLSLLKIVPLDKVTSNQNLQNVIMTDDLVVPEYTLQTVASFMNIEPRIPFEQIRTPILIMVGEHEQILPPEYCKRVYDLLNAEKKFVVIPDAGHLLFIESISESLPFVVEWFNRTLVEIQH
jgi:pimeloyl-ACP methyl ester carboxylesterase